MDAMPISPNTLAEARRLVVEFGMGDFSPNFPFPPHDEGHLVQIELIDPFVRSPEVPNFNKPDAARPQAIRTESLLLAIRNGTPLPPLQLIQRKGEQRYELYDGFHRLHLYAALGFTQVPATIFDRSPRDY